MEAEDIKDEQLDALKEVASISSGNASTALSNLIKRKVAITTPTVHLVKQEHLGELMGELRNLLVVIYSTVGGDVKGSLIIIFDKISMFSLIDILRQREQGETKFIQEKDQPVINELCNILNGNYLTALSNFLDIALVPQVPQVLSLQGETLVDFLKMGLTPDAKHIMTLKTDFKVDENITGDFVLMLPVKSIDGLLQTIEKKMEG
jgi:chemotaxis protein CheC